MNTATVILELPTDLIEEIKANAMARQQSVDEYLGSLIGLTHKKIGEPDNAETNQRSTTLCSKP